MMGDESAPLTRKLPERVRQSFQCINCNQALYANLVRAPNGRLTFVYLDDPSHAIPLRCLVCSTLRHVSCAGRRQFYGLGLQCRGQSVRAGRLFHTRAMHLWLSARCALLD